MLPLSYKSYLGMAKMKLLKPELISLKKRMAITWRKTSKIR
jgi:membrane protein insertase Oxa1/YidC/SpoIIIJ